MDQLTKLNKLSTPDKFNYAIYGCTKKFHPFYLWYLSNYKHHKESWENLIFLLKLLASLVNALKNTDKNNQTYTNFHTKSLRGELIDAIIIESYCANYILNPDIGALEFLKFFRFFKDLVKGQYKYCKYVRTTPINIYIMIYCTTNGKICFYFNLFSRISWYHFSNGLSFSFFKLGFTLCKTKQPLNSGSYNIYKTKLQQIQNIFFLLPFLHVKRMSLSTVSFLGQLDWNFLLAEYFCLTYDVWLLV